MSETIKSVVLIGAGNVGWHIGHALKEKGYVIKQVISKTPESSSNLASELKCNSESTFKKIDKSADLYIIAISDRAIAEVAESMKLSDQLVVHTSGSTSVSIFSNFFTNFGVFYPLQTFTKNIPVYFSTVPICIEANTTENTERLKDFAKSLSDRVFYINSEKRAILHLAAVFASNFPNHMFALAEEIVKQNGIEFDILRPLISETILKLEFLSPVKAQTGPAVRNDLIILEKHLKMLEHLPDLKTIYKLLSESVQKRSKKEVT